LVIQACVSPLFITHICSHTDLPGPMAEGNQAVDQLISFTAVESSQNPSIFQQALQSHSLLHQSANMHTNCSQPWLETSANILLGPAPSAVLSTFGP
jgi:hypothetical protein